MTTPTRKRKGFVPSGPIDDWARRGNCAGAADERMCSDDATAQEAARRDHCWGRAHAGQRCPVTEKCLQWAKANKETDNVAGGHTRQELRRLAKLERKAQKEAVTA